MEKDLEKEITLKKTYDLVLSIEVAEHLSKHSADIFVKNLISAGNIIVFSAAIPKQGGENHINEQWLEYWEEKFIKYNFQLHDVLRPIFWNNSKINWWYKQNIVLFVHKDEKFNTDLSVNQLKNVIHPELYTFRIEEKNEILRSIMYGELPIKEYILLLFKSIFGLNNIRTIKRNLNLCKTKIFRLF